MQPASMLDRLAIWRDRRRRARKLASRARRADVAVISVGKSGRTWLRAMISHIYHRRHDVPATELIAFDNLNQRVAAIPRILFTGVAANERAPTGQAWAEEVLAVDKAILLTRDPRDVAVSFYFQMTERATDRELQRKGARSRAALRAMPIGEFLLDPHWGVPRVARFLRDWRAAVARHPSTVEVAYEDLRRDTTGTFSRVARFIDPATSDPEIAAAVAFGDFGLMQARERDGFFTSERLRPAERGAADGFKVRRGKIGGYRDYLTAEQIAAVDSLVDGGR